ncbi:MAG: hypothetical protein ACMUJM_18860 [bacterium]
MKRVYKIFLISSVLIFSLLFLTSEGYSYYASYPYYGSYPTTSQYLPMYPSAYPYASQYPQVLPGSYPVVPIYPLSVIGTGEYGYKSTCSDVAIDKDYIYSLIKFEPNPLNYQSYTCDLVIFQSSISDDYEYISDIRLFEGGPPTNGYFPHKIIVQDDLAIIGTMGFDEEMVRVYIVDVSDKENPAMLRSLDLPHHFPNDGTYMFNIGGMAVESNVLYLCVSYRYDNKTALYSIDITNPEEMVGNNSVLDLLTIDYQIYDMVSASNHLYLAGTEADTEDQRVLIVNTSNPSNIFLSNTCDLGGIKEGKTNIVLNGATLFAVVQASGETGLDVFRSNEESSSVLKIIDVANPEQPHIVSSSSEVKGRPGTPNWGHELIVKKNNYAYMLVRDGQGSKIHVFNISNLKNPQLVNTEKVTEDVYTTPRNEEDCGMGLYLVDGKLYHHIGEKINIFDISNPLDISLVANIDLFIRMLAGGYDMPVLQEYENPYLTSPPSLYGYGGYRSYPSPYGYAVSPPPSLYGYGGYRSYPSSYGYGIYGGYGSFMPGPVIHIDEVNIEGGLYIGELNLGGNRNPWSNIGAFHDFPSSFINSYTPYRSLDNVSFTLPPPLHEPYEASDDDAWMNYYADKVAEGRVGMKIITKDDNGETITLQVGDKIEIVLPVINDCEWREQGYGYARDSSVISGVYTPPDMDPDIMEITKISDVSFVQRNFYTELKEIPVKTYEAKAQGEYELVLEYFSRSKPDEILDTFGLFIKVE